MTLIRESVRVRILVVLLVIVALVRLPGLLSRAIWYDETITLLETAGNSIPTWPRTPTPAQIAQQQLVGTPSLIEITEQLYHTDVHPPVYYWVLSLWRRLFGFSIETARMFSLACSTGTVLLLYLLLGQAQFSNPFVPSLVFALSSFGIYMGHEARAYALALVFLLLAALLSYSSMDAARQNKARAVAFSLTVGLCGALAFASNYLAIFPVMAIILWHLVVLWPISRRTALLPALITALVSLPTCAFLANQIDTRPHQFAGYPGILQQMWQLVRMNLAAFYLPILPSEALTYLVWGVVILLAGLSVYLATKRWRGENRRFLLLVLGLAVAPSIGLAVLNLVFHKHLDSRRYVSFALPGIAVIVSYGIVAFLSTRRRLGALLFVGLVTLQLTGVNWGLEAIPGTAGSGMRSLSQTIQATSSPSHVVVIGLGFGRGHPGTVIYELAPETMMAVLYHDSDPEQLLAQIISYEDVWLVFSWESRTAELENEFVELLKAQGGYSEVSHTGIASHLRKAAH